MRDQLQQTAATLDDNRIDLDRYVPAATIIAGVVASLLILYGSW